MGNLVGYAHLINAMELPIGAAATVQFQWPSVSATALAHP